MMYKLEFELTQHTPMIHFQARDRGATLRASEVKPKLDRYLIQRIGERDVPKEWLIEGQPKALNYKLSFFVKGEVEYYLPVVCITDNKEQRDYEPAEAVSVTAIRNSPYFANEDKVKDKKRLATYFSSPIQGEIRCKNEKLKKTLEQHLSDFFLLHNFGARQTKGFGSFTVNPPLGLWSSVKDDKTIAKRLLVLNKELSGHGVNIENCLTGKGGDQSRRMVQHLQLIQKFHHTLKTSIRGKFSKIRAYFHEKEIEWEKNVARKLVGLGPEKESEEYEPKYVRALLGLHGQFDFRVKVSDKQRKRMSVKVSHLTKKGKDKIERFASPITYKPIGKYIYMISHKIPKEILGQEFIFRNKKEKREERIYTPDEGEFDIKDFLQFVRKDIGLIDRIDKIIK